MGPQTGFKNEIVRGNLMTSYHDIIRSSYHRIVISYHEAKSMWRQLEKIDRKSFLSQQHDTISLDMNEFWKVNHKLNKCKSNLDNCPLTADEIADGFESLQWENHDDIKNYIFSDENSLENKLGKKFKIEEVKWDGPNKRTSLRCALMSCKSASRGKSGIN